MQQWHGDDAPFTTHHERTHLLTDLLRVRRDGGELLAPLEHTGAFTRMLVAVVDADEPRVIGDAWITRLADGAETHRVVSGVESALRAAVRSERTFRELGVDWAQ
ncbi:hypothetical protein [Microbacterium sp. bgisy189]|uniref:hypothetical protein n=1 Tax=Microbacterium sp. bgisy189 TaxID=3413798 RepID=UPI003EB8C3CC